MFVNFHYHTAQLGCILCFLTAVCIRQHCECALLLRQTGTLVHSHQMRLTEPRPDSPIANTICSHYCSVDKHSHGALMGRTTKPVTLTLLKCVFQRDGERQMIGITECNFALSVQKLALVAWQRFYLSDRVRMVDGVLWRRMVENPGDI